MHSNSPTAQVPVACEVVATAPRHSPAVSWLLCTHVADEQLRLALQSCLTQTFTDFELLVVTNGAQAEMLAQRVHDWTHGDTRVRIYSTPVCHLVFSLSLGLHYAHAELVARMDSDDLAKPERLQRQVDFMRRHPEVSVLGSAYEVIDADARVQRIVQLPCSDRAIRRALYFSNPLCHPSVMMRRSAVLACGAYLGGLHAEDYDLWLRLALQPGVRFANLPEACLSYRARSVGSARRSRLAYASVAAAQFRHFVLGQGVAWLLAAGLSLLKAYVRSAPAAGTANQ